MLNHNLLTQRKEAGCLCVVCRIPLLMTILEIHPNCLAELRTVSEKCLSLEDQQVVFVWWLLNVETVMSSTDDHSPHPFLFLYPLNFSILYCLPDYRSFEEVY